MLLHESFDNRRRVGLRLLDGHAGLEARHGPVAVRGAVVARGGRVGNGERRPKLRGRGELLPGGHLRPARKLEALRHDADDRVVFVVKLHSAVKDARVAAEVAPPEVVADDGDVISSLLLVFRRERAAQERRDAERAEEVRGRARALDSFGAGQPRKIEGGV